MYKAMIQIPDNIRNKFRYYYYNRNNYYTHTLEDLTTITNKHVELHGKEIILVKSMDKRYDYKLSTGDVFFKKKFINITQEVKVKFNLERFMENKEYYLLEHQFKLNLIGEELSFISIINTINYGTYNVNNIQEVFDKLSEYHLLERFYAFNSLTKTVCSRRIVA